MGFIHLIANFLLSHFLINGDVVFVKKNDSKGYDVIHHSHDLNYRPINWVKTIRYKMVAKSYLSNVSYK